VYKIKEQEINHQPALTIGYKRFPLPFSLCFYSVYHSDSEEVVTPLMLDGTYLSRNFATLGPLT